jgi:DNA polymerase-1
LDQTIEQAKKTGEVRTLLGRRRPVPELQSADGRVRSNAENVAVNSPVQGSAADIIKIAMLRLDQRLREEGLQAKMILQVHDELVFDVPKDEKERVEAIVREEMENAYPLDVPLKVDIGWGMDWAEAH